MDFTPEAFEKLKQELKVKKAEQDGNSKLMKQHLMGIQYNIDFKLSVNRTIEKIEYWELKNKYNK